MAQLGAAKVHVIIDTSEARRAVKRLRKDADAADRALAALEARIVELETRLAEVHGISLEVHTR